MPESEPDGTPLSCDSGPERALCIAGLLDDGALCGGGDGPARLAALVDRALAERELPVRAGGSVYFVYAGDPDEAAVAGGFNGWSPHAMARVCGADLFFLKAAALPGYYEYKIVVDGTWILDPGSRAFAFDDFEGNSDGKNSVLNSPGSGRGHLEWWRDVASAGLGNSRDLFVYVPPGFERWGAARYPVLFVHDGQNVFDDATCCFGNGGWEMNLAADEEIGAGRVRPLIIAGVANSAGRADEYTQCEETDFGGLADEYVAFLLGTVIPLVEAAYPADASGRGMAGSSLGGNVSLWAGLGSPASFPAGVGSLSGAFWVCRGAGNAVIDSVGGLAGRLDLPVYLDHGGTLVGDDDDNGVETIAVRDALAAKGWSVWDSSGGDVAGPGFDIYYHYEPGAAHDEAAWRARVWRLLRFLYPM